MPGRAPVGCPADVILERVLASEALPADARAHIDGCPHCGARLEWMRGVEKHFTVSVFPRTNAAVVERVTRPRVRLFPWLVPVVAAVAGLLLFITLRTPAAAYIGVKGSEERVFEVYLGENGHGRRLITGAPVRPGDGLRFVVLAPAHGAFVLSIDSRGKVSQLYPVTGDAPGPADGLLPGGAVLDDVLGPERLFAVYPTGPLSFEEVEFAARRAFSERGADGLRELERLPLNVPQDTLLLEKVTVPK